jgi:hypothetical protein
MKTLKEKREYNKLWMRRFRQKKREKRMLENNQCPVCGIFMTPENQKYHTTCPYYIQSIKNRPLGASGHPKP